MISTLNKANKSKMGMNVLANEDETKKFINSRFSLCCWVSVQCVSSDECAGRTCAIKGSSRKGSCLSQQGYLISFLSLANSKFYYESVQDTQLVPRYSSPLCGGILDIIVSLLTDWADFQARPPFPLLANISFRGKAKSYCQLGDIAAGGLPHITYLRTSVIRCA